MPRSVRHFWHLRRWAKWGRSDLSMGRCHSVSWWPREYTRPEEQVFLLYPAAGMLFSYLGYQNSKLSGLWILRLTRVVLRVFSPLDLN